MSKTAEIKENKIIVLDAIIFETTISKMQTNHSTILGEWFSIKNIYLKECEQQD